MITSKFLTHQRCYAHSLGACSSKISREHVISEAILRSMGGTFVVSGLPGMTPGTSKKLSLANLESKILCEKHNNALSDFDAEATRFFKRLMQVDRELAAARSSGECLQQSKTRFHSIDANRLERWLLKVFCGTLAAGWQKGLSREINHEWVRKLFYDEPLGLHCGLYFGANTGGFYPAREPIQLSIYRGEIANNIVPLALFLRLTGIVLIFSMSGKLEDPEGRDILVYRPSDLVARSGRTVHQVHFDWPAPWKGRPVFANVE